MLSHEPIWIDDTQNEARLTGPILEVLQKQKIGTIAILPLRLGERHLGALLLEGEEAHTFSPRETQPYLSLAPQVAAAIENKRLLEAAQARARREQLLREVTTRVRSAVGADTIMRAAVQEIGQTLGRPTFIYLDNGEQPAGQMVGQPTPEGS
jgi:GAF domain-containing protein